MSTLLERVETLGEDVKNFPLGNCGPSDDPDMQTAYLHGFRDIATRFMMSVKRIQNEELQELIKTIDYEPQFITDAYNLKAELIGVIDLISDLQMNNQNATINKPNISVFLAKDLLDSICKCLSSESANNLHLICEGYGLKEGTKDEAFKSKWNYVYSRISHFSSSDLYDLSKKLEGKYPEFELDKLINSIEEGKKLNLISQFEDIKELIIHEIRKANFVIWIAVGWFTDRDLANELFKKSREGVNIQILIIDDEINQKLYEKLNLYFEAYKIPKETKFENLMHHKFCMIDLSKVIHGSYNWTTKAQYNNETISLIENRGTAENFAKQFMEIKTRVLNQ